MHKKSEAGVSLIEIIFAIIVIGLVLSGLVASINTSENGTVAHRQLVTADGVLRNYAETIKNSVRTSCTSAGATWSATYSQTGFTVNPLSNQACPAATATTVVQLQVTLPNGSVKSLSIAVRTP